MAKLMNCDNVRVKLRAHALNTLPNALQRSIQDHLGACAACQKAFEAEQTRLHALDVLTQEEPPEGLADRTLERFPAPRVSRTRLVAAAALALLVFLPIVHSLAGSREAARRASTQGNMKQFGLIFKMYANESRGERWPQLADADGTWAPDMASLFGKFVTDTDFMVSEQHPDRKRLKQALEKAWSSSAPDLKQAEALMGESFAYLGYSVSNEAEFEALRRAKGQHALPSDTEVPVTSPGETLHPLKEGIERFLITDINNPAASSEAQSSVPVLIEIATWKYKKSEGNFKGTNVLYMDGHVAFVPLGTFPVLPSILDCLSGGE